VTDHGHEVLPEERLLSGDLDVRAIDRAGRALDHILGMDVDVAERVAGRHRDANGSARQLALLLA
jgi:hypothetical protein